MNENGISLSDHRGTFSIGVFAANRGMTFDERDEVQPEGLTSLSRIKTNGTIEQGAVEAGQ
jgi:hypothetical protein